MIRESRPFYKVLFLFHLVFMIPLAVLDFVCMVQPNVSIWLAVSAACSAIALIFSFYYVVLGYSKEQAWAYKGFLVSFVLSTLFSLVNSTFNSQNALSATVIALVFGLLVAMLFSKDLGKQRSLALCLAVACLCAVKLVDNTIRHPGLVIGGDGFGSVLMLRYASQLLLSVMLTLITVAKYVDKSARGTK